LIRTDRFEEAERLLQAMDEIYEVLITMDYPDALTGNLRRATDVVRGTLERTRGELTLSLREHLLQMALQRIDLRFSE
jgi:translin